MPTPAVHGYQTPRYRVVPDSATDFSNGDVAVQLFSSYGQSLDDWQAEVLSDWLALDNDGMFAASNTAISLARQNGKSKLLEARIIFGMIVLKERVFLTAQEARTARTVFARVCEFFEDQSHPEITSLVKQIKKSNGHESIVLKNGATLHALTRTANAARGMSGDLIIVDEAYACSEDALAALTPTILTSDNPQIIFASSPPTPDDDSEAFTNLREVALKAEPGHRVMWHEWSAHEGAEADYDDPDVWAQANPALGIRVSAQSLEDQRRLMSDTTFAREHLGLWQSEVTQTFFDLDAWAACLDETKYKLDQKVLALDVRPDRSGASVAIAGIRPDGKSYVEVIANSSGTGWIMSDIMEIASAQGIRTVVIDSVGPGSSFIDLLKAKRVTVYATNMNEMARASALLYDGVNNADVVHRGQPLLNYAISEVTKRKLGDGFAFNRRSTSTDITPVVSCALAMFGVMNSKVRKQKAKGDPRSNTKRRIMIH